MPDMEISIEFTIDDLWEANVYYPGFEKKSHMIEKNEDYGTVIDAVIFFLNSLKER